MGSSRDLGTSERVQLAEDSSVSGGEQHSDGSRDDLADWSAGLQIKQSTPVASWLVHRSTSYESLTLRSQRQDVVESHSEHFMAPNKYSQLQLAAGSGACPGRCPGRCNPGVLRNGN